LERRFPRYTMSTLESSNRALRSSLAVTLISQPWGLIIY
jgi:hypothetical protein